MEKIIRWLVTRFLPHHHLKLKPVQKGPRKKREPKTVKEVIEAQTTQGGQ